MKVNWKKWPEETPMCECLCYADGSICLCPPCADMWREWEQRQFSSEEQERLERFAVLVRTMRETQNRYFFTRLPKDLQNAKRFEVEVDKVIKDILETKDKLGELL